MHAAPDKTIQTAAQKKVEFLPEISPAAAVSEVLDVLDLVPFENPFAIKLLGNIDGIDDKRLIAMLFRA
jgi:hypothetical protein